MAERRICTLPNHASSPRPSAGWLLFIAVETATQVTFKYAGATLDDRSGLAHMIGHALTTPVVLLGFVLYFCGFLIWLTILKDIDLGRAFPMTAIIYVTTLASAVLLFNEMLNPLRIAGVLVIAAGVVLLASDTGATRRRTRPAPHCPADSRPNCRQSRLRLCPDPDDPPPNHPLQSQPLGRHPRGPGGDPARAPLGALRGMARPVVGGAGGRLLASTPSASGGT